MLCGGVGVGGGGGSRPLLDHVQKEAAFFVADYFPNADIKLDLFIF